MLVKLLPYRTLLLPALFILALLPAAAQTAKSMTNDEVVQMVAAGFDDATIIKAIGDTPTTFDTSVQALIALKRAGVGQKVIQAMLTRGQSSSAVEPPSTNTSQAAFLAVQVGEVGVYMKSGDKLRKLEPELASMKAGGWLKSAATVGIARESVKGVLRGASSQTLVSTPVEFEIRVFEGVSANEYQLLKLKVKGDRREFRTGSAGITGIRAGADELALIPVSFQKVGPNTYRARIETLEPGEYGWLQGGVDMRVYTFRVSR